MLHDLNIAIPYHVQPLAAAFASASATPSTADGKKPTGFLLPGAFGVAQPHLAITSIPHNSGVPFEAEHDRFSGP